MEDERSWLRFSGVGLVGPRVGLPIGHVVDRNRAVLRRGPWPKRVVPFANGKVRDLEPYD